MKTKSILIGVALVVAGVAIGFGISHNGYKKCHKEPCPVEKKEQCKHNQTDSLHKEAVVAKPCCAKDSATSHCKKE